MSRKLAWRKLLSDPPSAWQRLPLLTRGVGDEILRAVDSDGEIDCGTEQPAVVVCRLAAAHPRERRRVAEAVEELIAAGFLRLVERDGSTILAVQLPDLSLAAKAPKSVRSGPGPNQERARTEPEARTNPTRSEPEPDANRARTQPEVGHNYAKSLNAGSVEEKRREERREEFLPDPVVVDRGGRARARARDGDHHHDVSGAGGLAVVHAAEEAAEAARIAHEDRLMHAASGAYARALHAAGGVYDASPRWRDALRSVGRLAEQVAQRDGRELESVLREWAERYVRERETRRPDWWLERVTAWTSGAATGPPSRRNGRLPPGTGAGFSTDDIPPMSDAPRRVYGYG